MGIATEVNRNLRAQRAIIKSWRPITVSSKGFKGKGLPSPGEPLYDAVGRQSECKTAACSRQMTRKYECAAARPWLTVAPNPPESEP